MNEKGPDHYRFYEELGHNGVSLYCERFVVLKETPRGYWVCKEEWLTFADRHGGGLHKRHKRFVLKDSLKRHCYPDKMQAYEAYRIRKARHIEHLKNALAKVEQAIACDYRETEDGRRLIHKANNCDNRIPCGMPERFRGSTFFDY